MVQRLLQETMFFRNKADADDGSVCRSAIPQTEKVLQALGW